MDFNTNRIMGFYNWDGKDHGIFVGSIKTKGDEFCYKTGKQKEVCVTVFSDGDRTWEVDKKGVVTSSNQMLPKEPPKVPEGLKEASADDFKAFAAGKTFESVSYDQSALIIAITKWDFKKKTVSGSYSDGRKSPGKFSFPLVIADGKTCFKQGKKTICPKIMIDGNTFYEINEKGELHAVSTAF